MLLFNSTSPWGAHAMGPQPVLDSLGLGSRPCQGEAYCPVKEMGQMRGGSERDKIDRV